MGTEHPRCDSSGVSASGSNPCHQVGSAVVGRPPSRLVSGSAAASVAPREPRLAVSLLHYAAIHPILPIPRFHGTCRSLARLTNLIRRSTLSSPCRRWRRARMPSTCEARWTLVPFARNLRASTALDLSSFGHIAKNSSVLLSAALLTPDRAGEFLAASRGTTSLCRRGSIIAQNNEYENHRHCRPISMSV
jgi:hypothetical protein